jgi:anti-anti-sigma regulatory factor
MNVKINTKEKFHVITLNVPVLAANMTEDLTRLFLNCIQNPVKNIILNMEHVKESDPGIGTFLLSEQEKANENKRSFVICKLRPEVEKMLGNAELTKRLNITPTESEAWDMVQFEELEREMMKGEEN